MIRYGNPYIDWRHPVARIDHMVWDDARGCHVRLRSTTIPKAGRRRG